MKTKLSALLIVLALCASAFPAFALDALNDPLQTSNVATDRLILASGADPNGPATTNATQTSIPFSLGSARLMVLTVKVTECTTCSIRMWLEAQDADGTWYAYWTGAVTDFTAVLERRYVLPVVDHYDGMTVGDMSGSGNAVLDRPIPSLIRIRMVWTSGTSATYTVQGMTY